MSFSWNKPTVSLAEALVGPGFGRSGNMDFRASDNTGTITSQAAKKIFQAIAEGSLKKVKILLSSLDPDDVHSVVNASEPKSGRSPLMMTCWVKDTAVRQRLVEFLLHHEADINLVDKDGRTALANAVILNLLDVVQVLIARSDIDPNIADTIGNTPLLYAVKGNHDVTVRLLVRSFQKFGVLNLDHQNANGDTALSIAAINGNVLIASILVNSGRASLNLILKSGEKTKHVLQRAGFPIHKCKNGEWKFEVNDNSGPRADKKLSEAMKQLSVDEVTYHRRRNEVESQLAMLEAVESRV